jgi:hypothetical protein
MMGSAYPLDPALETTRQLHRSRDCRARSTRLSVSQRRTVKSPEADASWVPSGSTAKDDDQVAE